MAAPRIPTWKERLAACFRWRHRFLHVFGAPGAVGAVAAVASAAALNADVGLALGALTAGVGSLLAGYWVTAGFDTKLVKQLQDEEQSKGAQLAAGEIQRVVYEAEPEIRPVLERILHYHATIEAAFADGIDDQVEAILQNSRPDLLALRDRAVAMVKLYRRLREIIQQSDGRWLEQEVRRMESQLQRAPEGAVRDALLAAKESTERTLAQWRAAVDKQMQVGSVLTVIETNLQEFKLAMELRKADAAMGSQTTGTEVSELQARLSAAGEACDELVGRSSVTSARRSRAGLRPRA
ncbi:MAG: hypothetical protein WKG00_22425 [Polyangiaceae bacterium]